MFKETLTYKDFNGNDHTEDFYFNLTKAECLEMELGEKGGMQEYLKRIVAADDRKKLIEVFKEIIGKAYGRKSEDGRFFRKSKEMREEFESTEAYSDMFVKLATDDEYATAFIQAVLPGDISSSDVAEAKASLEAFK